MERPQIAHDRVTAAASARRWVVVAVSGCSLLLLSIVVGGVINDGYSQGRDYVSALSGRGSTAAFVGVVGLLGFSAANAAAGMTFRRLSTIACSALMAAGVAGFVVAMARISCPDGAARCSLEHDAESDALDTVHAFAVGVYELCFFVGVVAAAVALIRMSDGSVGRSVPVALVVLAVASSIVIQVMPEQDPGAVQRLWLAINSIAVLTVAFSGARAMGPSSPRAAARRLPGT